MVNSSSSLNVLLPLGDVSTTVEVTSTAASIDTTATAVTTNLTDTFYNSVPMPRNVSAIFYAAWCSSGQVASTPNVVTGPGSSNPSIGGASGLENLYVVDGRDDHGSGVWRDRQLYNRQHGSVGTGINLTFVQEVDVKTTAFEPEYGKSMGGTFRLSRSPVGIALPWSHRGVP